MTTMTFSDLMKSAADSIPTKTATPDGRYKLQLRSGKYEEKDGAFRLLLTLQAVQNLTDPSVDVESYEPVFASWSEKSPSFALEELGIFIKSHNLSVPFQDALPELNGKTYIGTLATAKGYQNLRGLRAED